MNRLLLALALLAAPAASKELPQQDKNRKKAVQAHPKVDQAKVDLAIRNGVKFLKSQSADQIGSQAEELILLTLVKAGADIVPENDKDLQAHLKSMLERPLTMTYCVSLQAMVLEELNRVQHQARIWQCAQFLVDNQSKEGYWAYGEPTNFPKMPKGVATGDRKKVSTSSAKGTLTNPNIRSKPDVVTKIPVKKQRDRAGSDHSNTQYACLGLRACHDAGIVFEEAVIRLTQKWWRDSQVRDGEEPKGRNVATGIGAEPPYGWSYGAQGTPYGSMTVGAIGGLAICDYILGENWKGDKHVVSGVNWMGKHFTVKENPGFGAAYHYYYLYGLERAGMLYGTELFGAHEWYPLGAEFLLKAQGADGSWTAVGESGEYPLLSTCWAILFLRRATRPLVDVASVDRFSPLKPDENR